MMVIKVRKTLVFGLCIGLAGAALAGLAASASADEPPVLTECFEGDQVIFTSAVGDIDEFDAEAYEVTLHQTIPLTEDNAVVYQFTPRDIMCVVISE